MIVLFLYFSVQLSGNAKLILYVYREGQSLTFVWEEVF